MRGLTLASSKPSLAQQYQAVRHHIVLGGLPVGDTVRVAAEQAVLTLQFLEKHADLYRKIEEVRKADPDLAALLHFFPTLRELHEMFPGITVRLE